MDVNGAFGNMTAAAEIGVEGQLPDLEQQSRLGTAAHLALRVSGAVLTGAAYLTPPVAGAVVGLTHPVHVEFAPGLEADAQVHGGETTAIDLGIIGGSQLPAAHKRIPLIGDLSGSIRVQPFSVPDSDNSDQLGLYAALAHDPAASITDPIVERTTDNALKGMAAGILADVAAAGLVFGGRNIRQRRQDAKRRTIEDALARHESQLNRSALLENPALESSWASITRTLEPKREPWPQPARPLPAQGSAVQERNTL